MLMDASMCLYINTSVEAMTRLDDERRLAEESSRDPQVWERLAQCYDAQGRPSQAGSCRRRAAHYRNAQVFVGVDWASEPDRVVTRIVSVETVIYANQL